MEEILSNIDNGYRLSIKVIGIGGAGNNMVSWLYNKGIQGAEIIACNTDQQQLNTAQADAKLLLGMELTNGLGCGGYPELGRKSAESSSLSIKNKLSSVNLLFICAGMGGGTGTGAAPFIAKLAKQQGAIVIGTVTMPFKLERTRIDKAEFGISQLREHCNTVIIIDNNRLLQLAGNLPLQKAFAVANELIATMIKGIVETIAIPSLVNLDYADVKAIMTSGGVAAIGVGIGEGSSKVKQAVTSALDNPLLEISYQGATGALIQIEGGPDLTLSEITEATEIIAAQLDDTANVIFGARINNELYGKVRVISIITGISSPYITGCEQFTNKQPGRSDINTIV